MSLKFVKLHARSCCWPNCSRPWCNALCRWWRWRSNILDFRLSRSVRSSSIRPRMRHRCSTWCTSGPWRAASRSGQCSSGRSSSSRKLNEEEIKIRILSKQCFKLWLLGFHNFSVFSFSFKPKQNKGHWMEYAKFMLWFQKISFFLF